MDKMMVAIWPAVIVFWRQVLSWRTNWRQFLLLRLVDPAIFFYGVGIGFARFIPEIHGYDYKTFLLPGSICLAMMYTGVMEGTYTAFVRAFMQRTWFSFLATPTRIWHIMAGEMAWCMVRCLVSVCLLIVVGVLLGAKIQLVGTLLALPFIGLGVMVLMSVGYLVCSYVKSINDFDLVWVLLITPMMVFSGVMVDFEGFPPYIQALGNLLPLTHVLQIVRPLMLGYAQWDAILIHTAALVAIGTVAVVLAHRQFNKQIMA